MSTPYSIFHRYTLLKQIPIFSSLNWYDLQKIARKSYIVDYQKGSLMCKENDEPDAFYCLISGRVQAYSTDPNGRKYDVEFIRRGMHFGVISLLTGEKHSLSFEAINDSVVLQINREDFQEVLKSIPHLGVELSHSISRRVRGRNTRKAIFESHVISIYAPVKGSGSSTYAVNLALSLQKETAKRVVLVSIMSKGDEDETHKEGVEGPTPKWKCKPINLQEIVDDHEKIINSVYKEKLPVDLLNVSVDPSNAGLVNQISVFVSSLVSDYHFVVVDLPNEMDETVIKTLTQSDIVQLIVKDEDHELELTRKVIDELEERLKENFKSEKINVIISGLRHSCYLSFEELNRKLDYDVFTQLPHIEPGSLNKAVVFDVISFITPDEGCEYSRAITKMARRISGVQIGLVLGGGAALGVAHIGVIKVLQEENIPIDIVVGSSMGALVAAFWVTGRDVAGLTEIASEFKKKSALLKLFDPVVPVAGLIGGRLINRWLKTRGLEEKTFYSTRIPLKIVAYDLNRREEIVLDSGSLAEAVRKSVSIPGVITPVMEDGKTIIDGGVLNPLPTNVLTGLGINKIIAINVLQSPDDVAQGYEEEQRRQKDTGDASFLRAPGRWIQRRLRTNIADIIVQSLQASEYVIAEQSAQHADVVIHPDLRGVQWNELYKVDEIITKGEEAARAALPEIRRMLKE